MLLTDISQWKAQAFTLPKGSCPLNSTILLMKGSHGPVHFKNGTPWISFIVKVSAAALIHKLFKRFLS